MSAVSPATKRLLAIGGLLAVVLLVVVLSVGAGGDGGGAYRVRAIFDTASFVVPGEDVKVAGVKVGSIESLDVTRQNKAAVVLRIDDPAFQDFRQDASCTIRLQSLIGEKFVACQPTQPKGANSAQPPPLRKIRHGDGKGQYLLPVSNTSSPVDIDLLNNIMRMPERQRLAIIVNELGVGLAGNGEELSRVIKRADPALQQFDVVLKLLAGQNRVLANLATESDAALAPLARQSARISDFIASAGTTAAATAERGAALEANFERFPKFLQELTPTARRLAEFAAAGTPVMADLHVAGPSVSKLFEQLGPFSKAALPTVRTLGNASDVASRALTRSQPTIADLAALARSTNALAPTLSKGLTNLQREHGIERLLDVILNLTGSANGFDQLSHYLRSAGLFNQDCLTYDTGKPTDNCSARFPQGASASSVTSTALTNSTPTTSQAPATTTAPASRSSSRSTSSADATSGLLGYLLGNDGGGR